MLFGHWGDGLRFVVPETVTERFAVQGGQGSAQPYRAYASKF